MRRVVTDDEARAELADEPYKLELIGLKGHESGTAQFEESESVEVGGAELTIYDNVDPKTGETVWKDLCRGPHLPNTRMIGNGWALSRVAAAYWRGSEKNPQLQRIYGTAWPTKDELRAYQHRLEEAAKPRPPQARRRARPVLVPRGDRLAACRCSTRGAASSSGRWSSYVRRRHIEEGLQYVSPRTSRRRTSSSCRATCRTTPTAMFPPSDGSVTRTTPSRATTTSSR